MIKKSIILVGLLVLLLVVYGFSYFDVLPNVFPIGKCKQLPAASSCSYYVQISDSLDTDSSDTEDASELPSEQQLEELGLLEISRNAAENEIGVHHYSKRQAWNADESLLILSKAVLKANDYSVFRDRLAVSSSWNWSNLSPDLVYGVRFNPDRNQLVSWNVRTNEINEIHTFVDYKFCTFGQGEGNLSFDDSLILLSCSLQEDGPFSLISFDLQSQSILGSIEASVDFNWGSVVPSGRLLVVEDNNGAEESRRLWSYDIELKNKTLVTDVVEHGDTAWLPGGDEYYVMLTASDVIFVNLLTQKISKKKLSLKSADLGFGHVSCLSSKDTGGCLLSTNGNSSIDTVYIGDAYSALKTGFVRHNKHFSIIGDYLSQPKASINRSGTKAVFSSNMNGSIPVSEFILNLEQGAIAGTEGGTN